MSRQQIIEKIEHLSEDEVAMVSRVLDELKDKDTKKARIMAYAGSWADWTKEEFASWMAEMSARRTRHETREDL